MERSLGPPRSPHKSIPVVESLFHLRYPFPGLNKPPRVASFLSLFLIKHIHDIQNLGKHIDRHLEITTMATPLPDFSDTAVFRTFLTIPQDDDESAPAPTITAAQDDNNNNNWYLLAQIKDNMTINKPTLVLTDRDANPFALVFEGLGRDDLDLKGLGFKKGCTAVIPCARRTRPADETKRGFVKIGKGDAKLVKAVPGLLARVLEVGGKSKGSQCETCGKECAGGAGELKSCTGCERVGYCSKVSFFNFFFKTPFSFFARSASTISA